MREGGGGGRGAWGGGGGSGTRQPLDQSGGICSKSSERRTPCQTATSDLSHTQHVFFTCCFTSTETVRTVRDREPRTSTSTFTQRLSSALVVVVVCCPIICADLHCSRAARRGIPHIRPHPGLIPHRDPAPRGPQEVTSDRWWAAIRRRHCTAAESVRWCSVMPVLIEHTQDTTYYTPPADVRNGPCSLRGGKATLNLNLP